MDASPLIREAVSEDIISVCGLWTMLVDEHQAMEARFVIAEDARERWLNDYPHWIEDELHCILVAESEGEIVGFIHAQCWEEPPIYATVPEVFIIEIYIEKSSRCKGIGAALVEELKQWSKGHLAERFRFGVLAVNAQGIAFWEALGAKSISIAYTIDLDIEKNTPSKKPERRIGF